MPPPKKVAAPPVDLASKEAEYQRLNAELEAKTASLLGEADRVLQTQQLLDNIDESSFLEDDDALMPQARVKPASAVIRKQSGKSVAARPGSAVARSTVARSFLDDAALVEAAVGEVVERMEGGGDAADVRRSYDALPAAANEMGSEAQIRFLKAKLRVFEEEMEKSQQDLRHTQEQLQAASSRAKEAEEERTRLNKSVAALQQQSDKLKKLADDAKTSAETAESQLSAARKESESTKRDQRRLVSDHSAGEVRLNRALEEVDRLKQQLTKSKSSAKDVGDADRRRVEQLLSENKRLEKQKAELIHGFKKQMKLIEVLKRQKLHLEAARVLQFSEEEFLKALDWSATP